MSIRRWAQGGKRPKVDPARGEKTPRKRKEKEERATSRRGEQNDGKHDKDTHRHGLGAGGRRAALGGHGEETQRRGGRGRKSGRRATEKEEQGKGKKKRADEKEKKENSEETKSKARVWSSIKKNPTSISSLFQKSQRCCFLYDVTLQKASPEKKRERDSKS